MTKAKQVVKIEKRHDLVGFFNFIESTFPVAHWKIDGIHIWPMLRMKLYGIIIHKVEATNFQTNPPAQKPDKLEDNWKTQFNSFFISQKIKNSKYLFCAAHNHRAIYKNKSYNKLFDPVMDRLGSSLLLEHSLNHLYPSKDLIYKNRRVLFIYDYYYQKVLYDEKRKERIKQLNSELNLDDYESFILFLKQFEILKKETELFELNGLKNLLIRFHDFVLTYNHFLTLSQPKVVFSACFYSFPVMAANYVANRLGITTVEMQHGSQLANQSAYNNWNNLPNNGYNTMPKTFWCWDKHSMKMISSWAKPEIGYKVFAGGNPWVDYFKSMKTAKVKEKIVLYTLQPHTSEYLFPEYIIEAIRKSNDFKWWIRLHPGQLRKKEEIESYLSQKEVLEKVNINEATELPLPVVLSRVRVHITNFSGCALEASYFNIPTLLINQTGVESFQGLIKEGKAFSATNENDFEHGFQKVKELNLQEKEEYQKPDYRKLVKEIID